MTFRSWLLATMLLALTPVVFAETNVVGAEQGGPVLLLKDEHLNTTMFPKAASDIRDGMALGSHYAGLSSAEKQSVNSLLDRIQETLDRGSPSAGTVAKRHAVRVNRFLSTQVAVEQNADSEMVCRRERGVGTRIATTVCRSKAEMALELDAAQQLMDRRGVTCPECGKK